MSPQRGKVTEEPGLHDSDGTTDHNLVQSNELPRAKRTRAIKRVDYRELKDDDDHEFDAFGGYTSSSVTNSISIQERDSDTQSEPDYTPDIESEDSSDEYETKSDDFSAEHEDADTQVEARYQPGPNFVESSFGDHEENPEENHPEENYHDDEGHVATKHDGAPSSFDDMSSLTRTYSVHSPSNTSTSWSDDATPEQVKKCRVCKETLPITNFDLHRPAIPNRRHHTCGACWRKRALSRMKKKGLKLDPEVKVKRWGARSSIEEMMLLAEQNGFDITYLAMCVRPQRYTRIATTLVALSNGQMPSAIEPPVTEGLILCSNGTKKHWARPEEFEQNPLEAPGTLYKLCKRHHEKQIECNRERRARNRIEGGTKGDGENTGKIRCSSNYQGPYGHWYEKEGFIDLSYKYCRDCILKNSGMQRKPKRTDTPNGTIVPDGPWKGMVQCRNGHCVSPDEYGPEKSPGEYQTQCLRHRLMCRELRQSYCRNCGYTYDTGSETKEHTKSCSRRFCSTCRRNLSIDELYEHKDDCYLKLKEHREVLVEKGLCAWYPYHNYHGCSEKPVEGRQRCQGHSNPKYYDMLLNTSAQKKELLLKLLGNEGQEIFQRLIDAQPHLVELIDQLDELLLDSPERVLFWDTEFFGRHTQDIEDSSTQYICQISIRNGRFDEVVPVATVSYPMTKSELWDLSRCGEVKWPHIAGPGTFRKFYGVVDDNPVTGSNGAFSLGLEEIATLLENYYDKHYLTSGECTFIEWSSTGYTDHKNVMKALRKVGKQNLVPNLPLRSAEVMNPLAWWRTLRDCVEQYCTNRKQPDTKRED